MAMVAAAAMNAVTGGDGDPERVDAAGAVVGPRRATGGLLGDAGQERAEEDGDDRGGERRVRPVIEIPAGALTAGARGRWGGSGGEGCGHRLMMSDHR
jgi:hypothetical protein